MIYSFFFPFYLILGGVTPEKGPHRATLYTKESCSYCKKVYRAVPNLESRVEIKDIEDPNNLEELLAIGKKGQVPCLVSNGVALYESDAIISTLTNSLSMRQDIED